jgi:hypothetical protein
MILASSSLSRGSEVTLRGCGVVACGVAVCSNAQIISSSLVVLSWSLRSQTGEE